MCNDTNIFQRVTVFEVMLGKVSVMVQELGSLTVTFCSAPLMTERPVLGWAVARRVRCILGPATAMSSNSATEEEEAPTLCRTSTLCFSRTIRKG